MDADFEEASWSTSFGLTDHIDCDALRADLTERLRSVRINLDNTSNGFVGAAIQRQIDSLLGQLEQREDECAGEAGDDGGFSDDSGDPNAGDDPGAGDDFGVDPECERQANALRDRIAQIGSAIDGATNRFVAAAFERQLADARLQLENLRECCEPPDDGGRPDDGDRPDDDGGFTVDPACAELARGLEEHIRELEEALSEETDLAILADLEAELEALKERCAPPDDGFGDDVFPDDDFDDGTDF